jgi:hypothetical protein
LGNNCTSLLPAGTVALSTLMFPLSTPSLPDAATKLLSVTLSNQISRQYG